MENCRSGPQAGRRWFDYTEWCRGTNGWNHYGTRDNLWCGLLIVPSGLIHLRILTPEKASSEPWTCFSVGTRSQVSIPFVWRKIPISDATSAAGPVLEVRIPENDRIILSNGSQHSFLRAKYDILDVFLLCAERSDQFEGLYVPKPNITVRTAGSQQPAVPSEGHA